jgi:uncharacterized protein YbaA (DUF1428 family)
MTYVDGYLTPVRPEMRDEFMALSARMAAVYQEYGALRIVDCWLDDAPQDPAAFHAEGARDALEDGAARTFRDAADAGDREVVVLSWMEWPDKATRDAGLARVLADPRVQPREDDVVVFDGRRLVAGGFHVIADL